MKQPAPSDDSIRLLSLDSIRECWRRLSFSVPMSCRLIDKIMPISHLARWLMVGPNGARILRQT